MIIFYFKLSLARCRHLEKIEYCDSSHDSRDGHSSGVGITRY